MPEKQENVVEVSVIHDEDKLDRKILFAYQEKNSRADENRLPVILIHGSPGSSEAL